MHHTVQQRAKNMCIGDPLGRNAHRKSLLCRWIESWLTSRKWRYVRPAMIDAIGHRLCVQRSGLWSVDADFDGVDEPIANRRRERQAVFMADELRDPGVCGAEIFFARGEVGAAASRFRHPLQELVGLVELLRCLVEVC